MQTTRKFYRPFPDDRRHDWRRISKYDLNGYQITQWWRGNPLREGIPIGQVKLYLKSGTVGDYIPNPLSLQICSDRLATYFLQAAPNDLQVFDAPILDAATSKLIPGYKLLNVVARVSCLDREQSILSYRDDRPGEISGISRLVIDSSKVPTDIRIFRLEESFPVLLMSQEVLDVIYPTGVSGLAFAECETSSNRA